MDKNESSKAKSVKALQNILEDPLKMRYLAKELFSLIDADGDEYIDMNEMYGHMLNMSSTIGCSPPNLEEVRDVVGTFDVDGDQRISIEEFEIYVREIIEKMIDKEYNSMDKKTLNIV